MYANFYLHSLLWNGENREIIAELAVLKGEHETADIYDTHSYDDIIS